MKHALFTLLALTLTLLLAACGTAPADVSDGLQDTAVSSSVSITQSNAIAPETTAIASETKAEAAEIGTPPDSGGQAAASAEPTPTAQSASSATAQEITEPPAAPETFVSAEQTQEKEPVDTDKRVRFRVGENEIIVLLADNDAADSFYAMLPMELQFSDFNRTEKIAYPDASLETGDAPDRWTPTAGDLCYYAPWGNLCFFYQDFRESPSLVPLGCVESGKAHLEMLDTVATVTAEAVE